MKKYALYVWGLLILTVVACEDPFSHQTFYEQADDDTKITIAAYLDKNPDVYSEWIKFLKYADFYNALNDSKTTVTLFAPTNDAMKAFYASKGISSPEELDYNYARNLVKMHIMKVALSENEFMQYVDEGSLQSATLFGTALTLGYGYINNDVDDAELVYVKPQDTLSIYINNQASVLHMAHQTVNGMVYTLGGVIRPLIETVVDKIHDYQIYTIFYEALQKTGWADRLSVLTDTTYNQDGSYSVRTYKYTVFATPDSIYQLHQIGSFSQLVASLGAGSDYTSSSNALYQYMAYHILDGAFSRSMLTNVFKEGDVNLFNTLDTGEVISVQTLQNTAYVNGTIQFIRSDIKASNGYVHKINDLMPVYKPPRRTVIWDFCNTSEIVSIVNNYGLKAKSIANLFYTNPSSTDYTVDLSDLQLTGNYGIASGITYLSTKSGKSPFCYYKCKYKSATQQTENEYGAFMHNLFLVQVGYNGWIQLTTPTMLAGKYKVELFYAGKSSLKSIYEQGGSLTKFTLDDYLSKLYVWKGWKSTDLYASSTLFDEVTFEQTTSHTFKALLLDSKASSNNNYVQMWDYIQFTPIE
jgi:uncharacterized surface protein with fasciclin (FAS1) repeats